MGGLWGGAKPVDDGKGKKAKPVDEPVEEPTPETDPTPTPMGETHGV